MTERIYYTDPYCRSFDGVVVGVVERQSRPAVTLDRTAFYPTSGGQPFDTGRLSTVEVVDVIDEADTIVHLLSAPVAEGARVHGEIDWRRRFDHMQQHTGQHVLSAMFDRLFDNRTLSFHMGTDVSTIDLAREMTAAEIDRAEADANRIVWDDRPVSIRFASSEEAERLPLRKEPVRAGTLRLIEIPDCDLSACGGTHVARTGAIGTIAVVRAERFKGGTRVTFVCGGRALHELGSLRAAVEGSVRLLSVLPAELPAAVERMQTEAKKLRKTVRHLQELLAGHEAARLVVTAREVAGVRLVVETLAGWDASGLKAIASAVTASPHIVVVLCSASSPALVVAARSSDLSLDAAAVLKTLIDRFGGRGGGKSDLAQGGGLIGAAEAIQQAASSAVEAQLAARQ
jgi:alanyl-tRNA synthetase